MQRQRARHQFPDGCLRLIAGLAFVGFVAGAVIADRVVASAPDTYHHPRHAIIAVPALCLAVLAWTRRAEFNAVGRAGLLLCLAGATANASAW